MAMKCRELIEMMDLSLPYMHEFAKLQKYSQVRSHKNSINMSHHDDYPIKNLDP